MAMGCGRAVRECACRVRGECVLLDIGLSQTSGCSARGAAQARCGVAGLRPLMFCVLYAQSRDEILEIP